MLFPVGVLRLAGGLLGIAAILTFLIAITWAAMWLVLLVVRHIPLIAQRHRHDRWTDMQREGVEAFGRRPNRSLRP
jgi:hypothetical protein